MTHWPTALIYAAAVGGVVAGALDYTAACVIYQSSPEIVGKAIAAGLLGREASFAGGIENAVLGAGLHFMISCIAAFVYAISSLPFTALRSQSLIGGIVFGLCMFLVMNYIVVPNSLAASNRPFDWATKIPDLGAHMLLFGPAIAFCSRYFLGTPAT